VEIRRFAENNLKAKALHTNLEGHFVTLCNHIPLSISLRSIFLFKTCNGPQCQAAMSTDEKTMKPLTMRQEWPHLNSWRKLWNLMLNGLELLWIFIYVSCLSKPKNTVKTVIMSKIITI